MYKWLCGKTESPFARGSRGFTLVELMIVIAVIAILMLVLVPRIGVLRQKSKEAGIKANFLMVEGIVRNEIENYTVAGTGLNDFCDKVVEDINAPTSSSDKIRNPITGNLGATTLAAEGDPGEFAVFAANDGTPVDAEVKAILDTATPTPNIAKAGYIGFGAWGENNKINVRIVGYDESGKVIESLDKTISQ